MTDVKVTFKIRFINRNRKIRGVEHIKVDIYEDNKLVDWLWMNEKNILQNKAEHGEDCFLNDVSDFNNGGCHG